MRKIKAIFKGANGSVGYQTDREYTLLIRHSKGKNIAILNYFGESNTAVEYTSTISFMDNWDNIRKA